MTSPPQCCSDLIRDSFSGRSRVAASLPPGSESRRLHGSIESSCVMGGVGVLELEHSVADFRPDADCFPIHEIGGGLNQMRTPGNALKIHTHQTAGQALDRRDPAAWSG